eukprot:g18610.t1
MVQITGALKSAGTKERASAGPDTKLRSSGVVVVLFRYQSDMRACLRKWDSFWAKWNNGLCKGAALPRFPIGGRPIAKLTVARAANPGDIHWAELAVPQSERIKRLAITNGVMFLLIAACFGAVYGLRVASMAVKESAGDEGGAAVRREWYQDGGLVNGAFTMLLINAIIPPIIPYCDFGYQIRKTQRSKLEARLPYFNEVLGRGPNPKDKEQQDELKAVKAEIEAFKRAHAPGSMNPTRRYATAIKTFVCCLLYEPVFPMISLVGLVGLCFQYWMDKPKRPLNADIANFFVRFVKLVGPIGLSVSFFIFLTPSFSDKVLSQFIISIVTSSIFSLVFPLSVWIRCWLGLPCHGEFQVLEHEDDYYQAQYMWSKEMKYHKDQFIYKNLPEDLLRFHISMWVCGGISF